MRASAFQPRKNKLKHLRREGLEVVLDFLDYLDPNKDLI